jgi:hypothetical protein
MEMPSREFFSQTLEVQGKNMLYRSRGDSGDNDDRLAGNEHPQQKDCKQN